MRLIAVMLIAVLILAIVSCLVGCKDTEAENAGEGGMSTRELKERGPEPPSGKKGGSGGGASQTPTGPKSGG